MHFFSREGLLVDPMERHVLVKKYDGMRIGDARDSNFGTYRKFVIG